MKASEVDAWLRFVQEYRPIIEAMPRFEYDPILGSFHAWISSVVRSVMADYARSPVALLAIGGTDFQRRVADEPDLPIDLTSSEADEICDMLNKAIQDRLLAPLPARSPGDLEIWLKSTGPPALNAAEVARELRKSISAVYAARHRIN